MAVQYLHGVETVELDSPSGPVSTVKSNVIGLIGTAPNADVDVFPLNTPVAVFANTMKARTLGTDGTLLDSIDAIYSQNASVVVVVRVEDGEQPAETWSNLVGSPSGKLGVWSFLKSRPILGVVPKLIVAPGFTSDRPTNGVSNLVIGEAGSNYLSATTTVTISAPPAGGRTATAQAQVVAGEVTGLVITDPGFGYTDAAPTVTINGAGTGATATATLGSVANPVGVAMGALVPRIRAVGYVDGPGTNYADAVSYRGDFGNQRIMVLDPGVLAWDDENSVYVSKPASAYAAGIQSRIDEQKGFWYPFSNNEILNIGGASRPVDWEMGDYDSEANLLNESQITTIIQDDGYRFWGLRGTGTDALWAQMAVRRTADMVYESLDLAQRSNMDKPFSYQLLRNIQISVNDYLDVLKGRGALVGGKCWIDPNLNTPATFSAGELTANFDLEPPASLEHLTFQASRNPNYYSDFIEDFTRQLTSA